MIEDNEKRKSQYPVRRESDDSLQAAKHQSRLPAQIKSNLIVAIGFTWDVTTSLTVAATRFTLKVAKLLKDIWKSDFVQQNQPPLFVATLFLGITVIALVVLIRTNASFSQTIVVLVMVLAGGGVLTVAVYKDNTKRARKSQKTRKSKKSWSRRGNYSEERSSRRTNSNFAKHTGKEPYAMPNPDLPKQRRLESDKQIWNAFVDKWGSTCWYCGVRQPRTGSSLHLDHILPRDGSNDDCWNRALACPDCNSAKGNKLTPTATIKIAFEARRIDTDANRKEQLSIFQKRHKWARDRHDNLKQSNARRKRGG